MAAPIAVNGANLDPGRPVALFRTRIIGGGTNLTGENELRHRPRRPLPDQHGPGRRCFSNHTNPKLEAAGEVVSRGCFYFELKISPLQLSVVVKSSSRTSGFDGLWFLA